MPPFEQGKIGGGGAALKPPRAPEKRTLSKKKKIHINVYNAGGRWAYFSNSWNIIFYGGLRQRLRNRRKRLISEMLLEANGKNSPDVKVEADLKNFTRLFLVLVSIFSHQFVQYL